jgi:SM-20-related protein
MISSTSRHDKVIELDTSSGFDLLLIRNFFDSPTRARILNEMQTAPSAAATVYKDAAAAIVDQRVRNVSRIAPLRETADFVTQSLLERKHDIGEHFWISLEACEAPHFLRYGVGDFFVAHQDGNTGLLRSQQEQFRKISVSIFLNSESDSPAADKYCGGTLVFHRLGSESYGFHGEAGMLVAFRAETTHEIVPITHGQRYAIACWYG